VTVIHSHRSYSFSASNGKEILSQKNKACNDKRRSSHVITSHDYSMDPMGEKLMIRHGSASWSGGALGKGFWMYLIIKIQANFECPKQNNNLS